MYLFARAGLYILTFIVLIITAFATLKTSPITNCQQQTLRNLIQFWDESCRVDPDVHQGQVNLNHFSLDGFGHLMAKTIMIKVIY